MYKDSDAYGDNGGPRKGFRGTAENSKTRLCTRWQQGHCRFGDRCNFAHGETELREFQSRGPPQRGGGPGPQGGYYPPSQGGYPAGPRQGGYQQGPPMTERDIWVASGCPVQGPAGWTMYQTPDGDRYFHNRERNETQWEPPAGWKDVPGPHR